MPYGRAHIATIVVADNSEYYLNKLRPLLVEKGFQEVPSETEGPIVSFQNGNIRVLITYSPDASKEGEGVVAARHAVNQGDNLVAVFVQSYTRNLNYTNKVPYYALLDGIAHHRDQPYIYSMNGKLGLDGDILQRFGPPHRQHLFFKLEMTVKKFLFQQIMEEIDRRTVPYNYRSGFVCDLEALHAKALVPGG